MSVFKVAVQLLCTLISCFQVSCVVWQCLGKTSLFTAVLLSTALKSQTQPLAGHALQPSQSTRCSSFLQALHGPKAPSLVPEDSQQLQQLEDINSWVYDDIANGAYKAGFASAQLAYEAAYKKFFLALDRAELILSKRKWVLSSLTQLPLVSQHVHLCFTSRNFDESRLARSPDS